MKNLTCPVCAKGTMKLNPEKQKQVDEIPMTCRRGCGKTFLSKNLKDHNRECTYTKNGSELIQKEEKKG